MENTMENTKKKTMKPTMRNTVSTVWQSRKHYGKNDEKYTLENTMNNTQPWKKQSGLYHVSSPCDYGVATISTLLKNVGL